MTLTIDIMNKKLTFIFFLFNSLICLSQTEIEINNEKLINNYSIMSVFKAQMFDDTIYLASRALINSLDDNYLFISKIFNGDILTNKLLELKENEFARFHDLVKFKNGYILVGQAVKHKNVYVSIGYLNNSGSVIWSLKLKKKTESFLKIHVTVNNIEIFTRSSKGIFRYILGFDGKILSKEKVPVSNGFTISVNVFTNNNYLVLSTIMNERGETGEYNIDLFDHDLNLINNKIAYFNLYFRPIKIFHYNNEYIFIGNSSGNPWIYFLDQNLTLRKTSYYYYHPEQDKLHCYLHNYHPEQDKLRCSLQVNDIELNRQNGNFIASGIIRFLYYNTYDITYEHFNIIFELNEDKILNYKILGKTGGTWENNNVLINNRNFTFFGDYKIIDGLETEIKMIDFEIK
jgi:hypothetical protein